VSFDIDIRLRRGDFGGAFAFASDAAVTALVGPSGSGKTSLLLAIAGVVRPDAGHIRVAGRTLFDSAAGIDVPPRDRGLGVVFQDSRLFPHMRVRANLGYAHRAGAAEIEAMAEWLGLAALLDRWPRNLSGGETRRVALGRALLAHPAALLLDEPLSNLDPARVTATLAILQAASSTLPLLYVTHVLAEAQALGARIITVGASQQIVNC
jgi:molybdate transport system ATP-binding protein